ncbi:MAG: hypothetical protein DRP87_03525 [Spirochaetes bacterium]|nr:MAG: hypothetical protein DRP87_03525 [Spirochaetota bacterium]
MCLSNVYLNEKDDKNLVIEDASVVSYNEGAVQVKSLFGKSRKIDGYIIAKVDLEKNFVILKEI